MISPLVVGIGALLVCFAFMYELGYSAGKRAAERLYAQYPPRSRPEGCLCIQGAMLDNPRCPHHGESTAAQSGG